MGSKIVLILFIVVLLGLGFYLITSGVLTKGITGLNALITPSSTGGFFDLSFSPPNFPNFDIGEATSGGAIISGQGSVNDNPNLNSPDVPTGYTLAQLSPYFHEVRVAGVSAASVYSYGTITLDAYLNNATDSIDVTGWTIKARNGNEYVPQAVNLYDPTGLAPASDILLKSGDVLYMYSSSAPFNLRLNECTGYMAHVADFVPALPLTCPYIEQSQIATLSDACQQYINSIGSCQGAYTSNMAVPQDDYSCQEYLNENFTYRSCFDAHSQDANFLSNQVWAWTGSNIIDQYHDNIVLLDKNGLLVDEYTY